MSKDKELNFCNYLTIYRPIPRFALSQGIPQGWYLWENLTRSEVNIMEKILKTKEDGPREYLTGNAAQNYIGGACPKKHQFQAFELLVSLSSMVAIPILLDVWILTWNEKQERDEVK